MSLCALTLCCGVTIIRVIRVESWEVFLNIPGTVWSTAKKLCMRIDIMEGQVHAGSQEFMTCGVGKG